ncbi:TPA: hypothetical protein DCL30_02775, partial [Candidatus Peribacteria bacterium]|nr:hypothetical protein [Candidatus Peribacteria bacterium]
MSAKKFLASTSLFCLFISQAQITLVEPFFGAETALAQEATDGGSESSAAAETVDVPSASSQSGKVSASCFPPTGDFPMSFTWQIICGEAGTNRNLACEEACEPCFSDTYYFWRKFLLKEMGYFYFDGSGHRVHVAFATGSNICRDGVSPTSGAGTVPAGITAVGTYTTWKINEYTSPYTLYSDLGHFAIVCSRGNGRTDYYWDDGGNPGTHNDGRLIINAQVPAQCGDGVDNDGDGATDYPADYSCSSATDNDETNPKSQCQDGVDNDGNGFTDYPADTGCTSKQDNTESGGQVEAQCQDGIDNDGDGATDYPADYSCSSATDNDETNPKSQCQDGVDNDGNGFTDYPADTGCTSKQDNSESGGQVQAQCNDGVDNDGDGATDYPADYSCSSATDNDETNPKSQCQDGVDNDGDSVSDYPNDPGCTGKQDNDEHNICPPAGTGGGGSTRNVTASFNSFNAPWNYGGSCAQAPVLLADNLTAGDTIRVTGTSGSVCGREWPRLGACVSNNDGSIFGDCDDEGSQMHSCTDTTYSKIGFYNASNTLIEERTIASVQTTTTVPSGATKAYVYFKEYNPAYYYDNNGAWYCGVNATVTTGTPTDQCHCSVDADCSTGDRCSNGICVPAYQCSDGVDNDGDGATD